MKILILENELYLAQNASNKLTNLNHQCFIARSINDIPKNIYFDCVIFSHSMDKLNIKNLLYKYKGAIFIILVTYISHSSVFEPMELGVHEYLFKPFSMKELINKIDYLNKFNKLTHENEIMRDVTEKMYKYLNLSNTKDLKTPLFMKGDDMNIEVFATHQANILKLSIKQLSFIDILRTKDSLLYDNDSLIITKDFDDLEEDDKREARTFMQKYVNIIATTKNDEEEDVIIIDSENLNMQDSTIASYIESYIINNQKEFNDTQLAKNLGISRKNLWEKRKKYGIEKGK